MKSFYKRRSPGEGSRLATARRRAFGQWTSSAAATLLLAGCSVYYLPQADQDAGVGAGAGGASSDSTATTGTTDTIGSTGSGGTLLADGAGSGGTTGGAGGSAGTGSSGSGGGDKDAAAGSGGSMNLDASNNAGGASNAGGKGGAGGASNTGGAGMGLIDAGVITIDDSVKGSGLNQFNYVGSWQHCKPCTSPSSPPLYLTSNSWIANEDAMTPSHFTFAFNGTSVVLHGVVDPRHGTGAVSIDEGPETTIDFYDPLRKGDQPVFTSPTLPSGMHVFRFRVTGTKSANSSGLGLAVDRIDIR